jgi:hypothetical protein
MSPCSHHSRWFALSCLQAFAMQPCCFLSTGRFRSLPLECGLALWLSLTNRMWQQGHFTTYWAILRSFASFALSSKNAPATM